MQTFGGFLSFFLVVSYIFFLPRGFLTYLFLGFTFGRFFLLPIVFFRYPVFLTHSHLSSVHFLVSFPRRAQTWLQFPRLRGVGKEEKKTTGKMATATALFCFVLEFSLNMMGVGDEPDV